MQLLRSITVVISRIWARGCLGKGAVIFAALLVLGMCSSILTGGKGFMPPEPTPDSGAVAVRQTAPAPDQSQGRPVATSRPTTAPEPTAVPRPTSAPTARIVLAAPTDAPKATAKPKPTSAPAAPAPTKAPAAGGGVAGSGTSCPADHPIKGNIRDRNPGKGDKIYHVPGDNGYAATKPEQCFATAADAEAAGYRPVK